MVTALVIHDAEVDHRRVDVRVEGDIVTAVGPAVDRSAAELVDAAGGALLPGLHDHHVHLLAMAARRAEIDLDHLADPSAVDRVLASAALAVEPGGWIRAGGYDEHRHGALDRHRLDTVAPGVALRVQHRSGLSWVLDSEGLRRVGVDLASRAPGPAEPAGVERGPDGSPTGWLHRLDGWLADRIPRPMPDLAPVGRRLAAVGITGVTDATPRLGPARLRALREAIRDGSLTARLVVLGADDPGEVEGWATLGPAKLLADEYVGLDPDALAESVASAHAIRRAVAIHAVTRAENVVAVTALTTGPPHPGDRIEHGSVLPPELDPALAARGITIVVQPALVAERGDHHLATVEPADLGALHRAASLLAAGVRVAAGSDAPVTDVDPWASIAAASTRRTRDGRELGPAERVPAATALGWYLSHPQDPGGPVRRVGPGAPADLCLLHVPLAAALARPTAEQVRATWVGGRLVGP